MGDDVPLILLPDSFWLFVLNEVVRLVMFLKMGISGLAGICPLS
jgi:hypothetical protein